MSSVSVFDVQGSQESSTQDVKAGRVRRLVAQLMDFLLVPVFSMLLAFIVGAFEHAEDYAGLRPYISGVLAGIAGYLLVNGWLMWKRGQTLGKKLLGIRVVHSSGEVASFYVMLGRMFFFPLQYLLLSPFWPLALIPLTDIGFIVMKNKRCLHDFICSTDVVRIDKRYRAKSN